MSTKSWFNEVSVSCVKDENNPSLTRTLGSKNGILCYTPSSLCEDKQCRLTKSDWLKKKECMDAIKPSEKNVIPKITIKLKMHMHSQTCTCIEQVTKKKKNSKVLRVILSYEQGNWV